MQVTCNGEELSLLECKYKTAVNCARSEVAGVKCSQRDGKYYLKKVSPKILFLLHRNFWAYYNYDGKIG